MGVEIGVVTAQGTNWELGFVGIKKKGWATDHCEIIPGAPKVNR